MRRRYGLILAVFLSILFLYGCVAVGVPNTEDPVKKLEMAQSLIYLERPSPAMKMLKEATDHFIETNDAMMLGVTYNIVGQYFLDYSNPKHSDYLAAMASFEKSLMYFELYRQTDSTPSFASRYYYYIQHATNSAYNLGELMQLMDEDPKACEYFNISHEYYKVQKDHYPEVTIKAKGYADFEEAIMDKYFISKCQQRGDGGD